MADDPKAVYIAAINRAFRHGFGGVLKLEASDCTPVIVDGRGETCVIIEDMKSAPAAQCTWRASLETFMRVLDGARALDGAFISSRLQIHGDMSVMNRLSMEPKS